MNRPRKNFPLFKISMTILYLLAFAFIAYYLYTGSDFYLTELNVRPHHPEYRSLRPAGLEGHGFGVIGSFMMLLMLLYSVRKRTRLFKNVGFLSLWLQVHIFFGVVGPLLIILHSSFKVQGLIAVSFWSMVAVALSGVLGRYLYTQIPRTISGKELSLDEVGKIDEELTAKLKIEDHLDDKQIFRLLQLIRQESNTNQSSFKQLLQMIFADLFRPFRYLYFRKKIARNFPLDKKLVHQTVKFLLKKEVIERRIRQWSTIHRLFHYWHVIHKPFAILMYTIMFVHILVAVYVGYMWLL